MLDFGPHFILDNLDVHLLLCLLLENVLVNSFAHEILILIKSGSTTEKVEPSFPDLALFGVNWQKISLVALLPGTLGQIFQEFIQVLLLPVGQCTGVFFFLGVPCLFKKEILRDESVTLVIFL